mmetsp:Transcript_35623/g.87622  ORF Transcript_35623/g.87622 Transcript_35623/m.87622 type:complete len:467 (-) Transcript_35623:497-1897(-)
MKFMDVIARMIQDGAALSVARLLEFEDEVCGMHSGDKIGQSAVGCLVRTRNRRAVNPFPEGAKVMKLCQSISAHFGHSDSRRRDLERAGVQVDAPKIVVQQAKNGTRIAAQHNLAHCLIRLDRGLHQYVNIHPTQCEWKTDATTEMWMQIAEFEATLNCSKLTTTLCQTEVYYLSAFGHLIKTATIRALRANKFSVVVLSEVTRDPMLPRREKSLVDFTPVGRECVMRARLEAERRFCGNTTEEVDGTSQVAVGRTEMLSLLLDPRTNGCSTIERSARKAAEAHLEDEYVKFSMKAAQHARAKLQAPAIVAGSTVALVRPTNRRHSDTSALSDLATYNSSAWSDDEEEPSQVVAEVTEAVQELQYRTEFSRVWRNWRTHVVEWKQIYPEEAKTWNNPNDPDTMVDLMQLDMGKVIQPLVEQVGDPVSAIHPLTLASFPLWSVIVRVKLALSLRNRFVSEWCPLVTQ